MGLALARLKRRAEFLSVAAAGRKWAAPGLVLQAQPHVPADDTLRVGFTVTRKVGNAVVRNRVRRRLKAAAQRVLPTAAAPGFDLVVVGRAAALERPFAALVADLEAALGKVKARRPAPAVPS